MNFKGFISFESCVLCLEGGKTVAFFVDYVNPQASATIIYIKKKTLTCSEIMEKLRGKKQMK